MSPTCASVLHALLCPAGSDEEMADAEAAAAPEEAGRTVGSGRQAAQGKKVYKDQKAPKTGGHFVLSFFKLRQEVRNCSF